MFTLFLENRIPKNNLNQTFEKTQDNKTSEADFVPQNMEFFGIPVKRTELEKRKVLCRKMKARSRVMPR
jgi:hypothetical protein